VKTLRVNPIACDGHGLCAELLPERVQLDDWGFPIVDRSPIPPELEGNARRAVGACPTLALRLEAAAGSGAPRPGTRSRRGDPSTSPAAPGAGGRS
jgi:ferredoxin